jgi:hypothetical protein
MWTPVVTMVNAGLPSETGPAWVFYPPALAWAYDHGRGFSLIVMHFNWRYAWFFLGALADHGRDQSGLFAERSGIFRIAPWAANRNP